METVEHIKTVILVLLAVVATSAGVLILFVAVNRSLRSLCVRHAKRFCRRRGLKVESIGYGTEFDSSGVKSEYTLVEVGCVDDQNQRRLLLLSVWLFGIHRIVREEVFPSLSAEV